MKKALLSLMLGATAFAQSSVNDVRVEVKEVTVQPPPKPGVPLGSFKRRLQVPAPPSSDFNYFFDDQGPAQKPLVILGAKQEANVSRDITEDLAIMAKVVEDSIAEDFSRGGKGKAMGIVVRLRERRSPNIFIEDHGAIFFVNVGIPLSAPSDEGKKEKKETAEENSAWEEARKELFGKPRGYITWEEQTVPIPAEFDQAKLDLLKASLCEAIQQSVNIRHLKPTDYVTIVVHGAASGREAGVNIKRSKEMQQPNGDVLLIEDGKGEPSTMVLRARRDEIEASNKQKETPVDFAKRVSVAIY